METQFTTLREKIRADKAHRAARDVLYASIWVNAHSAGLAAGSSTTPQPMGVCNPRTGQTWIVDDGACGFAWVTVRPATCAFARWAKKNRGATVAYGGGMQLVWVQEFNQSLARKEAYARAFADVLRANGIPAQSHSRMD